MVVRLKGDAISLWVRSLGGSFAKVDEAVLVAVHGLEDFEQGVDCQSCEIEQQERPEDVDLKHFEVGAGEAQAEGEGGAQPEVFLAEGADEGFVAVAVLVEVVGGTGAD